MDGPSLAFVFFCCFMLLPTLMIVLAGRKGTNRDRIIEDKNYWSGKNDWQNPS
jgi:hypothetical protein